MYHTICYYIFFLCLQVLHRGTTVLHLELDTHQVASVFLKLERCSGTITWCRPPWKDPRFGFGLTDNNGSSYSLDTVETAVSPGLRLKYTNRSGESLAYQVTMYLHSIYSFCVVKYIFYIDTYLQIGKL